MLNVALSLIPRAGKSAPLLIFSFYPLSFSLQEDILIYYIAEILKNYEQLHKNSIYFLVSLQSRMRQIDTKKHNNFEVEESFFMTNIFVITQN